MLNRRSFLKQIGITALTSAIGMKIPDKPEYKIFKIDCRAHGTYINQVKYVQCWHPEDMERAIKAQRDLARFESDFVNFHGARAIRWLVSRKS